MSAEHQNGQDYGSVQQLRQDSNDFVLTLENLPDFEIVWKAIKCKSSIGLCAPSFVNSG